VWARQRQREVPDMWEDSSEEHATARRMLAMAGSGAGKARRRKGALV
jgi:hypothetical protein